MRIKIINHELGIGACSMADIPAAVMEGHPREEIPFFYLKERDWIVLVEEHPLYEPFRDVISTYLGLDVDERKIATEQEAFTKDIVRYTIDVLDEVIKYREGVSSHISKDKSIV